MTGIDLGQRSNDCMVFHLFLFLLPWHHITSSPTITFDSLIRPGDAMRSFLSHELLAKMDGHKNGMPNMPPATSSCLENVHSVPTPNRAPLLANTGKMLQPREGRVFITWYITPIICILDWVQRIQSSNRFSYAFMVPVEEWTLSIADSYSQQTHDWWRLRAGEHVFVSMYTVCNRKTGKIFSFNFLLGSLVFAILGRLKLMWENASNVCFVGPVDTLCYLLSFECKYIYLHISSNKCITIICLVMLSSC